MGSPDIDNWIQDAKESVAGFWDEHVEKPVRYFVYMHLYFFSQYPSVSHQSKSKVGRQQRVFSDCLYIYIYKKLCELLEGAILY